MFETIPFLQEAIETVKVIFSPSTVKVALSIVREELIINFLSMLN